MATYRQVHISFWQDGFVLGLTPEEKYFYLYLMTNSKTTQCGIYELPKRVIEMETGYNRDTVDKMLDRFIKYRKIDYNEVTQEIIIFNWIKHNSINSPKVKACIVKELKTVKHNQFKTNFYHLCKRYGYPIDSLPIDSGEEKEEEQEKEDILSSASKGESKIYESFYSAHKRVFGFDCNPLQSCKLSAYIDQDGVEESVVIRAIERAALKGTSYNFNLILKILNDYATAGAKTLTAAQELDEEYERRKESAKGWGHAQSRGNQTPGGSAGATDSGGYYDQFPGLVQNL